MAKYRKKPVVVEAEQWFPGKHVDGVGTVRFKTDDGQEHVSAWIFTLEGRMEVSPGDWIITGVRGEKYPCKPDIFEATYEPADTPPTDSSAAKAEVARLRAALKQLIEDYKRRIRTAITMIDDPEVRVEQKTRIHVKKATYQTFINEIEGIMNDEALSTTTEPTDAAKVERFECPCCGCEISINAPEGDGNDA